MFTIALVMWRVLDMHSSMARSTSCIAATVFSCMSLCMSCVRAVTSGEMSEDGTDDEYDDDEPQYDRDQLISRYHVSDFRHAPVLHAS